MKRKIRAKTGPIKTFWFDLGNVILFFDFKPAYRALSRFTPYEAGRVAQYFCEHPTLEADVDEGRVTARKLFRMVCRDLKAKSLDFGAFCRLWNEIFKPNHAVVDLVKRLKARGYRLVLISNTNRLHWDYLVRKYPVLGHFHKHVLSFRVGVRKPGRRIYHEALRASRAKSHEIIYIDDRHDLTSTASVNHGIHTHTYRNLGGLKRTLKKLGLPAPR